MKSKSTSTHPTEANDEKENEECGDESSKDETPNGDGLKYIDGVNLGAGMVIEAEEQQQRCWDDIEDDCQDQMFENLCQRWFGDCCLAASPHTDQPAIAIGARSSAFNCLSFYLRTESIIMELVFY